MSERTFFARRSYTEGNDASSARALIAILSGAFPMTLIPRWKTLACAFALVTAAGSAALAQQGPAPANPPGVGPGNPPGFQRGQGSSNRDMRKIGRGLDRMIAALEHDQRDYGGHRVTALNELQQARGEITAAEQYARANGY